MTKLNEEQQKVVTHDGGPCLVAAVPGAGKTRCIVERIKHLIDNGEDRKSILAVTFTNKATKEMQERLEGEGYELGQMIISTFHSFCVKILRKCGHLLGYAENFTIYDSKDQEAHMKQILKEMGMLRSAAALKKAEARELNEDEDDDNLQLFNPIDIIKIVELVKNSLKTKEELENNYDPDQLDAVDKYNERLRENNAMDFTDLLYNTYILFEKYPKIAKHYSKRFKHILVDEVQDTNKAQYALIEHLMKIHENVILVGDEDQSIYGWRQAEPANIKKFINRHNPKIIKLQHNYRSTPAILSKAQTLIEHNNDRIEKQLAATKGQKGGVKLVEAPGNKEESRLVAKLILKLVNERGLEWSDCAVLYRANQVSHEFEEACRMNHIPYKVYGGFGFYDRKEVKTFMSYLRFLSNPKDIIAFHNCVNEPKRGIGEVARQKLWKESFSTGKSLIEICENPPSKGATKLPKKAAAGAREFASLFTGVDMDDPVPYVRQIATESGYIDALQESDMKKNENRADNVLELVNSFEYWADKRENPKISDYLQEVQLLATGDEEDEIDDNHVRLMTMHSAKGLEFPAVFMVACEEGMLPHHRSIEEGTLDEERRLAYVAMTRAEEWLIVTRAKSRWQYGEMKRTVPSRFLFESGFKEMPKEELVPSDV